MPGSQRPVVLAAGAMAVLLGGIVTFGWLSGISVLVRLQPGWPPMVPATAVCFLLSGLSLLISERSASRPIPRGQAILAGALLVVVVSVTIDFALGGSLDAAFVEGLLARAPVAIGHMSPVTAFAFLIFGAGLLLRRVPRAEAQRWVRRLAVFLIVIGLGSALGYGLNLQYLFESLYVAAGLNWMAFHTACGVSLLGVGLWCLPPRGGSLSDISNESVKAAQIYRTTIVAVSAIAVVTALIALVFLTGTVERQASANILTTTDLRGEYIDVHLEFRTQRALVAAGDQALRRTAMALLDDPLDRSARAEAGLIAKGLVERGFSAIAIERGARRVPLLGESLPDTAFRIPLHSQHNASLSWHGSYFLETRIAAAADGDGGGAVLLMLQTLPRLDALLDEANRWGDTGSSQLCGRAEASSLHCFPERNRDAPYRLRDEPAAQPMTRALAGQRGVETGIDDRRYHYLAAYRPVGDSGLGLVTRMDMEEIFNPVRQQLTVAIPALMTVTLLALWLTRRRAGPLIRELAALTTLAKAEQSRFVAAMESSPDAFIILESVRDKSGDITDFRVAYLNENAAKLRAFAAGRSIGATAFELFPNAAEMVGLFRTVALTGEMLSDERRVVANDGRPAWYSRQVVAMKGGVAVTLSNITATRLAQQQLDVSNRLRSAIVESAAYAIISTDSSGTILSFNKAAERLLQYDRNEMVGKATPAVFHDGAEVAEYAKILSAELGESVSPGFDVFTAKPRRNLQEVREWTYVRKDGSRVPVRLSIVALYDEMNAIDGFLGVAYDISEQKRVDEYIRHIALHDVLTGLPNRALLADRVHVAIEQYRRNGTPFALVMMDIDHFKHVNDSLGHHVGDRVLKEVVNRLGECVRPTDTIARMGGDEFVLVLTDTTAEGAAIVARRIVEALVPVVDVGQQNLRVTTSMGISAYPMHGDGLAELMRTADVAMYWTKAHGRNGFKVYSPELDRGSADRLLLENSLLRALEQNEFSLFYQPQIDIRTNAITAVEALLRWRKGDGGFTSPATFIPLAEETGLIVPIGKWVLQTACRDAGRLREHFNARLGVAVNISSRQFVDGGLRHTIEETLNASGLDPGSLEIEITESLLMDERFGGAKALRDIHALGVGIAIDDFGTGYSSLSYLKRFPIDRLKIDQSFVRDVTVDSNDAALASAIIGIGHSLDIPVIAEGVETSAQLAFLSKNGCDQGQGYFFARPMPFDDLMEWLGAHSGQLTRR